MAAVAGLQGMDDRLAQASGADSREDGARTDAALYSLACHGDEEAVETLLRRYLRPLTDFIRALLRDPRDVEEVALDAFAELVASRGRFAGKSSLKTYLFAIARHLAFKRLGRRAELPVEQEVLASLLSGAPDAQADPDPEELREALQRLPLSYRQALSLVYLQGMSYKEAGEVMGKNLDQVTHLVRSGKHALKKLLEMG